ncbi:transforming acidic coiled-coil-containing protein 3-like isoform X2 [Macrobrachium nipponense]|uniref:transforming acidic coiled-coil-containing protein 3-like isoform X2 n=1 Tax=Macrobrachium nipponense TaxID=159736 RepID=UPI0030C867CA
MSSIGTPRSSFIAFMRFIMGLKNSKAKKGSHSASRADSDQKKKGGVPPPGSADTPCKLEEEADVQRVTTEPVSESINSTSPPSTPRSPVSDTSPESLSKDCETPSTAEEVSFASCLTDSPNSLSENLNGTAAVRTQPLVNSVLKGVTKNPEASVNSVSDSVELNNTQNGVKKDSEYESAEEVDLPPDPTVVTQQPSSDNCLPVPPVTDCTQSPGPAVTPSSDKSVSETETQLENSIVENSINGNCVNVENGFIEGAEDLSEQHLTSVDTKESAISDSLVTVTRNEVIEETISTKACVEQEVTEVISSHTVINDQVSSSLTERKEESPLESQGSVDIKNECNSLPVSKVQQEESASCFASEVEKAQPTNEEGVESNAQNCAEKTENSTPVKEELLNCEGNEETNIEPVNHCESKDITSVEKQVEEISKDSQALQTTQVESKDNQSLLHTSESSEVDNIQPPTGNKVPCDSPTEQVTEEPAESALAGDDVPIPPKKGYCLDFLDNLDDPNFNPFATKTAVRNTPPPSPEAGRKLPPLKPAIRKKKDTKNSVKNPEPSANAGGTQNPETTSENKVEDTPSVESKPSDHLKSDEPLEVNLEDSTKSPSKPPPRRNCKPVPNKKPVSKTPKSKVIEKNNNRVNEKALNETDNKTEPEELPLPPSKGYNLDFLDNLDDPNFNPFATKCAVSNSPPKEGVSVPNDQEPKPKVKVVSPKKTVPKKGFSVIKNKVKAQSEKQEQDIKPETAPSSEENKVVEETSNSQEVEDLPVQPKKGYNLDFLDDPNFDPFKPKSCVNEISDNTAVETSKPIREVLGGPCTEEPKTLSKETSEDTSQQSVTPIPVEQEEQETLSVNHVNSEYADVTDSPKELKETCSSFEGNTVQEEENCRSSESSVPANGVLEADKVENLEKTDEEANSQLGENKSQENEINELKVDSKGEGKQGKDFCLLPDESESFYEGNLGIPKVPSIGTIGHLDSLEFAQLLGNEASRLAEEFMNCSTDSGLPDSDDSVHVKSGHLNSNMADKDISTLARLSAHLDENINPFQKTSKLQRSPPLGRRDACGAEGGDGSETFDPFKPRRALLRESGTGEERLDTYSLDDDSGIALGTRSDLETDVNHSEAGPEIATGLTSSDLQCASQLKTEDQDDELFDQITDEEFLASEAFFKEATDIENQLRKGLSTPLRGSQSKLSGNEVTPTKDKSELSSSSTPDHQSKTVPSTSTPVPPHEERSAPEGTSSPTPRPSDTSEHKPSSSRPNSIPPEGYMSTAEELQFEEKLLRAELVSGEKEKKLRQAMKDEQKEMSNLGETVTELTQSRDALLKLVGQYKGMLASLVSEKEKEKQNQEERIKTLEQERNQALEDLANVEVAFSDVHRKYERTKQVVDTLRRNEETLRGAVTDYENKLQKQEQKFIEFQKHAEEKIQLANEEFEAMRRANDQEMTKMAALLKKAEMKIMSLQDSNDRKTRENQELTQLCDDLINKVGTSH